MKKILFLFAVLTAFLFVSCSSDDEKGSQTFFVNVYYQWDGIVGDSNWGTGDKEIAEEAFVYLYENEGKTIDNSKSAKSVVVDDVITYSDGSVSKKPKYETKFQSGIFNLEDIQNGSYVLWVVYMKQYGGKCYSSYKNITVNDNYRGKTEEKVFKTSMSDSGLYLYQPW